MNSNEKEFDYKEETDNDELLFMAEEAEEVAEQPQEKNISWDSAGDIEAGSNWKILVVDDEEDIHTVTHLTLDDFKFSGKPVRILDAYSAAEAYKILSEEPGIAIMLLDVVMETTTAGLELVQQIREELNNHFVRIILRTGQPGYAPEREVVTNYDINDYKSKTELTADKIFTLVSSGLRAYKSLLSLESYRRDLQKKVEAAVESIREKDHIIIRQSRQTAISELIANLSHQWRQPLNTVMALIQDIEFSGQSAELSMEYLEQQSSKAMGIIQEMSETIDDLRYFFEPVEEFDEFEIGEVVNRCVKLLEPALQEEKVRLEITGNLQIKAKGYRNDYAQVILQIINNSRDALQESKTADKWVKININANDEGSLVEIRDNGGGIAIDAIDHVFEPYFTTRFKSPGKGLSLYMCQIVIEKNMGGSLSAGNIENGAMFTIRV
ncbi:MAG: hybrid sensor histidine kinase/response regulator [Candidatus Cloacimonetes bacterium]|nr:hybrid sensor histidine kinase/response regulator [Candidatus Cloacimonadota bacterium]